MKRRDFLINSTLAAGGLTIYKSSVLNANDQPETSDLTDSKPFLKISGEEDLSYKCASMPEGYFELLPHEAVRYSKFPVNTKHNAIWDFNWGHDGKMYVALCGELGNALSAILFEYDRETGKMYEYCANGCAGPISTKLYNKLRAIQYGEEPDTHGWCTIVE